MIIYHLNKPKKPKKVISTLGHRVITKRTQYEIFETADLPLKLIPATLLCLIGAFLDFLSGRILKVCSMYSDFQKIERKK